MRLCDSIRAGDFAAAERLIELGGADLGERGDVGETALHCAAEKNDPNLVALLLAYK